MAPSSEPLLIFRREPAAPALKAYVRSHTRIQNGRVVLVGPYTNRRAAAGNGANSLDLFRVPHLQIGRPITRDRAENPDKYTPDMFTGLSQADAEAANTNAELARWLTPLLQQAHEAIPGEWEAMGRAAPSDVLHFLASAIELSQSAPDKRETVMRLFDACEQALSALPDRTAALTAGARFIIECLDRTLALARQHLADRA